MSPAIQRFETRDDINSAIQRLVEAGVALDDIDVHLANIGAVDLDLCVECLDEMVATLAAKALVEALEAA